MTTLTHRFAEALRAMVFELEAQGWGDTLDSNEARTLLSEYDSRDRLTNAGDWQVEPGTLTISGSPRKGRSYREPLAYVPREILNRELIAPRIVACVNACSGIPTDALETMPLREAVNGVWQTAELERIA